MNLLIKNIKGLAGIIRQPVKWKAGKEMNEMEIIENGFLLIRDGKIHDFGTMDEYVGKSASNFWELPESSLGIDETIDAEGKYVLPAFVDSHTHIVFAQSREQEFVDRINGLSYEEIAKKGGGILNSAGKLQNTSEDDLYESALVRLLEMIRNGTGAIEIKSGYGLTHKDEIKMLRVIKRLKEVSPIPIKATFLGAHAIPVEYKADRNGYVELVTETMLPEIVEEGLADYIDVFCDRGFFTVEETASILEAGRKYGLRAKIHANELGLTGGVQVGVEFDSLSVDHLEHCGEEEISCLLGSNTMATALPGTAFFLGIPYPPARYMIDSGLPVALATDYNPGSCPSGKMSFVLSLACLKLKMTPEEAINAATINGAYALEMTDTHGSITAGKVGSVIITKKMPSLAYLPYSFTADLIDQMVIGGKVFQG